MNVLLPTLPEQLYKTPPHNNQTLELQQLYRFLELDLKNNITLYTAALKSFNNKDQVPLTVTRKQLSHLYNATKQTDITKQYAPNCTYVEKEVPKKLDLDSASMDLFMSWVSALQCDTVDMPLKTEDILVVTKINRVYNNVMYITTTAPRGIDNKPNMRQLLRQVLNLMTIFNLANQQRQNKFHDSVSNAFFRAWQLLIQSIDLDTLKSLPKMVDEKSIVQVLEFEKFVMEMMNLLKAVQSKQGTSSWYGGFIRWWSGGNDELLQLINKSRQFLELLVPSAQRQKALEWTLMQKLLAGAAATTTFIWLVYTIYNYGVAGLPVLGSAFSIFHKVLQQMGVASPPIGPENPNEEKASPPPVGPENPNEKKPSPPSEEDLYQRLSNEDKQTLARIDRALQENIVPDFYEDLVTAKEAQLEGAKAHLSFLQSVNATQGLDEANAAVTQAENEIAFLKTQSPEIVQQNRVILQALRENLLSDDEPPWESWQVAAAATGAVGLAMGGIALELIQLQDELNKRKAREKNRSQL